MNTIVYIIFYCAPYPHNDHIIVSSSAVVWQAQIEKEIEGEIKMKPVKYMMMKGFSQSVPYIANQPLLHVQVQLKTNQPFYYFITLLIPYRASTSKSCLPCVD